MSKILESKILKIIESAHAPIGISDILKKLSMPRAMVKNVKNIINKQIKKQLLLKSQNNLYWSPKNPKLIHAEVIKINKTFGFAKDINTNQQYFIPGRYMFGVLPGDLVIITKIPSRGGCLSDAKISVIVSEGDPVFFGKIFRKNGKHYIHCEGSANFDLRVTIPSKQTLPDDGNLVKVKITHRGLDNDKHIAKLISIIGDSNNPEHCCKMILEQKNIRVEFPSNVIDESHSLLSTKSLSDECDSRLDLRNETIFTIDGQDSKDLDDAVSIVKLDSGNWKLGVHIADVSYYVSAGTNIDQEAFHRGTSIYYADSVIPMLPKQLSNGICSLNPNEDRLTLSALLDLDENGNIIHFEFKKSVIRSRIKGIYEEINQILDKTASENIQNKYAKLTDNILLMKELADILRTERFKRGSLNLETAECKIKIQDDKLDIYRRSRGVSENIIEEFMLKANEAAALFARKNKLPFIYRIHDNPPPEKFDSLCSTLINLNLPKPKNDSASELSKVISSVEGTSLQFVVNNIILRSLAKAKYSSEYKPHYGLVLNNYSHFTSPIRRYPDLIVHRIISRCIAKEDYKQSYNDYSISKQTNLLSKIAMNSSVCENNADEIERDCENIYKAFFMSKHIGETFEGIVSCIAPQGVYVQLQNTVEGLITIANFPPGNYECIGSIEFRNTKDNDFIIKLGASINVKLEKTDIYSGQIDFSLVQPEDKI